MTEALNFCCIGARQSAAESGIQRQLAAFAGQLGAMHLFEDCLSLQQARRRPLPPPPAAFCVIVSRAGVAGSAKQANDADLNPAVSSLPCAQIHAVYSLGPDYYGVFSPMESSAVLEQAEAAAALLLEA